MSRQHARHSPSQLDRLAQCIRFKYIESTDMETAASEGSALHYSAETGDMTGLDEFQRRDVQQCLDYVMVLKGGKDVQEFKEYRVELKDRTFGHADLILVDGPILHVADFKFTRVEGEHDFQLTCYGAAMFEMLKAEGRAIEKICTHIIAPRLGMPEVHEYQAQELYDSVVKRIDELYERIDNPFNPPTPEPGLCSRCARAAMCPAISQTVVLAAPKITGLPLPEAFAPDALVSVRDRALAQQIAGVFETWSEAVKKANAEYVKNGGEIPGYKLQTRSTGFRIAREMTLTAVEKLKEKFGWPMESVVGALSLSVPELADQMALVSGMGKDKLKAEIIAALEGIGVNGSCSFLAKVSKKDMKKLEGG